MLAEPSKAVTALHALSSYGLAGSAFTGPDRPLAPTVWRALIGQVQTQRVWAIAARALGDGEWAATDEQREEAVAGEVHAAGQLLLLDRTTLRVGDRLDRAGVTWRLLKGPAHAQLLWSEPFLRPYSDVDLLVPSGQYERAVACIEVELSGRRHRPDPYPGMVARVGKSATFTLPSGIEIDLHRTLCEGPFGASIEADRLFDDPGTVHIGTTAIPTLSRPAMFVHACLHTSLAADDRRVVPRRDVAEGMRAIGTSRHHLEHVLELAAAWRSTAAVADAINQAVATFALPPDDRFATWAAGYRCSRRERRWLGYARRGSPADPFLQTAATALAHRSWQDRALYARGVLFHADRDSAPERVGRVVRAARRQPTATSTA